MVKQIDVNKAALDVVQVLAKHDIPIYMIGEVFQTAFKTVESQKVSSP
ncbi:MULTISPECIES: hypothetical protein [unclassified Paenibacillus]